jgi:DDE superfamily endonuclease
VQVRALMQRLPEPEALPIYVFDAGYDPVKLQRSLEGCPAQILVRLHSNRVFYAAPEEVEPRPVGRPRRHGNKFDLKDPSSWPKPTGEHRCNSEDYGEVRVRAWSGLHPKTRRIGERYGCERAPVVCGTVVLWWRLASCPGRPASRRSSGCGGAGRAMQISTSSGRHTAAGSTSNIRYGF